jgi:hypothetical protein
MNSLKKFFMVTTSSTEDNTGESQSGMEQGNQVGDIQLPDSFSSITSGTTWSISFKRWQL